MKVQLWNGRDRYSCGSKSLNTEPFKIRTLKRLDFECVQYLNVRNSSPHSILVFAFLAIMLGWVRAPKPERNSWSDLTRQDCWSHKEASWIFLCCVTVMYRQSSHPSFQFSVKLPFVTFFTDQECKSLEL